MKKEVIYKSSFGNFKITEIELTNYQNNDNLAIELYCWDEEYGGTTNFATLTVNLQAKLPPNLAFVDTNNVKEAEDFIKEYGLGTPTGMYGKSGFCSYPLYEFNLDKIKEL